MSRDLMTPDEYRALLFPDFKPGGIVPPLGTVLIRRKARRYEKALGHLCALYVVWKAIRR